MKKYFLLFTAILFSSVSSFAQIVHIPDSTFKSLLINDPLININGDTSIQVSEALAVKKLAINDYSTNSLKRLTGIESMINIEDLDVQIAESVSEIDFSKNTLLKNLRVSQTNIQSLDLSNNTGLMNLISEANFNLKSIVFGENAPLGSINISYSDISSLDLSMTNDSTLQLLHCFNTKLTSLDLQKKINLGELNVQNNFLTVLDLSNQRNLNNIFINNNPGLKEICVFDPDAKIQMVEPGWSISKDSTQEFVYCGSEPIVTFPDYAFKKTLLNDYDVNKDAEIQVAEAEIITNLQLATPYGEDITSLAGIEAMSNLTSLTGQTMYSQFQRITKLNLSKNTLLTTINIDGLNIDSLDLRNNTALTDITFNDGSLKSVLFGYNTPLAHISLQRNQLTDLNLSMVRDSTLIQLYVEGNKLTHLNISGKVNLASLNVYNNQLSSLDLSDYKGVYNFLNVSANPALKEICAFDSDEKNNDLWMYIPIFKDPAQKFVYCGSDPIVTFDDYELKKLILNYNGYSDLNQDKEIQVSEALSVRKLLISSGSMLTKQSKGLEAFGNLTYLDISGTYIKDIDFSKYPLLDTVYCFGGSFTEVDLSKNTRLISIDFGDNYNLREIRFPSDQGKISRLGLLHNNLTYLNVAKMTSLRELLCNGLSSVSLDLTKNRFLNVLYATESPNLKFICVANIDSLNRKIFEKDAATNWSETCNDSIISIADSNMKAAILADLSINTDGNNEISILEAQAVVSMNLSNKSVKSITGLENFPNLTSLKCDSNQLTSIDVSHNPYLTTLDCSNNLISSISTDSTASTHRTNAAKLDLSKNTNLTSLDCSNNHLTFVNVSSNTLLAKLNVTGNAALKTVCVADVDAAQNNADFKKDATAAWSNACSKVTDMDEPELSILKNIYPNPVRDILHISGSVIAVAVYNQLGQQVLQAGEVNDLDVSALNAGMYQVFVTYKTERKVFKLVKE